MNCTSCVWLCQGGEKRTKWIWTLKCLFYSRSLCLNGFVKTHLATSAPLFKSILMSNSWPCLAAAWRGVLPDLSTHSTSAPTKQNQKKKKELYYKIDSSFNLTKTIVMFVTNKLQARKHDGGSQLHFSSTNWKATLAGRWYKGKGTFCRFWPVTSGCALLSPFFIWGASVKWRTQPKYCCS